MYKGLIIFFVAVIFSSIVNAENKRPTVALASMASEISMTKDSSLHPAANNESWYLSGLLENEQAEIFAYYFVVQRVNDKFTYFTQIISLQTGKVIFKYSQTATISLATRQGINFKIADGFLRYNEINNSWIFGVDSKKGYNLRVESLQVGSYNVSHLNLISFYTLQSKRVNGQLSLGGRSDFVISNNAWLSHQWRSFSVEQSIQVERLLCRFVDNQGVMLVRAYLNNDVIFSLADLLGSHGESHPVSQFSLLSKMATNLWQVKLFSPKKVFDIITTKPLTSTKGGINTNFYLGAVKPLNKNSPLGSCMVIKENIASSVSATAVRQEQRH